MFKSVFTTMFISIGVFFFLTTEKVEAQDTLFTDHFENIGNWTIVGPLGLNNWYVLNTNLAGGEAAPELVFRWDPLFIGDSYILSPVINGTNNHSMELIFTYSIDWWSNIMTVGIAYTSDGGTSYTSIWEEGFPGNYPPTTDTISFTGVDNLQIAFYYTGDSNDADFWYIDDVYLIDLSSVPVELVSFTANAINNNIELNWNTATELNNKGFEIQRKSEIEDYTTIGFVEGHGTTSENYNYNFVDKNPDAGIYYYRLKQIDLDGSFEYSDEIMITISGPTVYELAQNYPNPFNPSTKIIYEIPEEARNDNAFVTLKVYDVLGNEVATLVNEEKSAGKYEVEFYANSFNSGTYFYRLSSGSFTSTKKMILLK